MPESNVPSAARLLSTHDAARYLGVSRWTLQRLVNDGTLVPCEVKSKRVYDVSELDAYIARQKEGTMATPRIGELVADLAVHYRIHGNEAQAKNAEARWRLHLQPFFGKLLAGQMTTGLQREYRVKRQQAGATTATINRELQVLRHAYNIALRQEPAKIDRVPYFELVKENNARLTYFTLAQVDQIRAESAKVGLWLRTMVEIAYVLGWRKSEILRIKISGVNLEDQTIQIPTTKNGEPRECPMTPDLALFMEQMIAGRDKNEYVFFTRCKGEVTRNFNREWPKVLKAVGLEDRFFHDFRRTSARSKRAAGVDTSIIMDMQGWKTNAMFKRYAITNLGDQKDALKRMADWSK
jgi:excisionase family DNA binding protein